METSSQEKPGIVMTGCGAAEEEEEEEEDVDVGCSAISAMCVTGALLPISMFLLSDDHCECVGIALALSSRLSQIRLHSTAKIHSKGIEFSMR